MSGFLWLLFSVVLAFHTHNHVVVVLGFLAIVAWGIPVTSALPWVRVNYHEWVFRTYIGDLLLLAYVVFSSWVTGLGLGELIFYLLDAVAEVPQGLR
jgi:hypothetical protein